MDAILGVQEGRRGDGLTSNWKVIAFLNAHAEVFRQEFRGNEVRLRCYLPRHLLHHIEGPTVRVRWLNSADARPAAG